MALSAWYVRVGHSEAGYDYGVSSALTDAPKDEVCVIEVMAGGDRSAIARALLGEGKVVRGSKA